MINLTLIISDGCQSCFRAEEKLKEIAGRINNITFTIININDFTDKKIFIVPALVIDDELFSYGDIDEDKLLKKVGEKNYAFHKSN